MAEGAFVLLRLLFQGTGAGLAALILSHVLSAYFP